MDSIARAIEVARDNGWIESTGTIVVWDRLACPSGTRLEVGPVGSGFRAEVRDRGGRASLVSGRYASEADACRDALDRYLHIVNVGI